MARKTKEQARATREAILDAAQTVFHEKGVSRSTLGDVAEAAGVTRGAIYWHFENKVDLFNQMHARVHLPIEAMAVETARTEQPDPMRRLRALLVLVLRDTARNPRQREVLDIVFNKCEFACEMQELATRQEALHLEAFKRTEFTLRNAMALGELPADLDARRASITLHCYIRGVLSTWLLLPSSFDLAAEAEALVENALSMLRHSPALLTGRPDGSSA